MVSRLTNQAARHLLFRALRGVQDCCLEVVCGDGTFRFGDPMHELRATIAVHDKRFFHRVLKGGDIGAGESYMDGDWSSPDLVNVVRAAIRNLSRVEGGSPLFSFLTRLANWFRHRRNDNTLIGSRKNIAYHYDLGNDFYRLFLDENLAYSCAVFESANDSLEQAQQNKFDLICRKLDLQPEDHVLEIGTGWGGFALYAATHYGCRITTTTISRQQHDYAAALFRASRMHDQIELLFEDYRRLEGRFDKIVSIEMFEAVGYKHYDEFFQSCDRLLHPNGSIFIQTITMNERHFPQYLRQSDWIKRYIFPGAELASVQGIIQSLGRTGQLQLFHLDDIGMHYAETLKAWRLRFWDHLDEVRRLGCSETFIRMWEFYLSFCEGAFRERYIGDAQILLARPGVAKLFNDPRRSNQRFEREIPGTATDVVVRRSSV